MIIVGRPEVCYSTSIIQSISLLLGLSGLLSVSQHFVHQVPASLVGGLRTTETSSELRLIVLPSDFRIVSHHLGFEVNYVAFQRTGNYLSGMD